MKQISTLMAFFISTFCFGQVIQDSLTIEVINQIINPNKKIDTIAYTATLSRSFSEYYKKKFSNKNRLFKLGSDDGDTLVLTKNEIDNIVQQLDTVQNHLWQQNLFSNSKIISIDSVWDYLEKPYYKRREVHIFSKPIFIRNNSLCLLYHLHLIGNGGPDYFGFYKNQNGVWKKWIAISSGYLN